MRLPLQRRPSDTDPVHGDHAVVLGASMAGLLAARVLAEFYDQVTVIERDVLGAEATPRRGVPQGRHLHVLLARGGGILEELFPGLLGKLVAAGAPSGNRLDQFHFEVGGHVFFHDPADERSARPEVDGALFQPSRALLDAHVLGRVRVLPNVGLLDGCDVAGLTSAGRPVRVTGVRVVGRDGDGRGRELPADLVVCATGRSGRAPGWLQEMGFASPSEEEIVVGLRYATSRFRVSRGSLGDLRGVLVGATPRRPTGAIAFAQPDSEWMVTLQGYAGHHPPLEPAHWLETARRLLPAAVGDVLAESEQLEDPHQHRFPASLRRHYERLDDFPEGFLVVGDALSSFNPVYGQGMTVAALEALALRDALRAGESRLAQRFFAAAAKPVNSAWQLSAGADLALPTTVVPGPRPRAVRMVNAYVDRFQAAAEHDPVMAWRFIDVTGFDKPMSALFSGDSLRRVTSGGRRTALATASGSGLR